MKCASKRLAEGTKLSIKKSVQKASTQLDHNEGKYTCYLAQMNWLNGLVHI